MDFQALMKQAQQVQQKFTEAQAKMHESTVSGASGAGLVAIELKIGTFKPADAGQMELYLRWLDRNERQKGEEKPIGIILCAGTSNARWTIMDLSAPGTSRTSLRPRRHSSCTQRSSKK